MRQANGSGGTPEPGDRAGSLRILLVAGNPDTARVVKSQLARSGLPHHLETRSSLEEGRDLLRRDTDVLVVVPDRAGAPDADPAEQTLEATRGLPVVVLGAPADPDRPRNGGAGAGSPRTAGAVERLRRDEISPESLARAVRTALKRSQREAEGRLDRTLLDGILAALPQHIALLDGDGELLHVNDAWLDFAIRQGGDVRGYVGESYIRVLESAADQDEEAREMLEGLRAVLDGDRDRFEMEYPCPTLQGELWFQVAVSPVAGEIGRHLVVSHTDITARVRQEAELRERTLALRERVKEQDCLQDISAILHDRDAPLEERIRDAVERIPEGWQHPDVTRARLTLEGKSWSSADGADGVPGGAPSLTEEVLLDGESIGELEVRYTGARTGGDGEPFLEEERDLLEEIAHQISVAVGRHRARLLLEESEQRYRSVVEHHPDSVYSFDLDGVIQAVSPATERLTGFDATELLGTDFTRTVAPEYREKTWRHFRKAAAGEPQSYETVGVTPDGTRHHYQVTNLPIVVDGEIRGVFGIARDITARKRAEEQLRQSEERWASVFELAPTGILISEAETGRFVSINQEAAEIIGFDPEELVGRTSVEVDCWADLDRRDELVDRVRAEGSVEGEEAWLRTRSGDLRYARLSARFLELEDRDWLLWTVEDRTEERRREEALRRSEERFRALFESSRDPIVILTGEGRILEANDAALRLSGYEREEIASLRVQDLLEDPSAWERFRELLEEQGGVSDYETRMRTREGELRVVQASANTREESGGERIQAIFRDVTDRRRLEENLRYRALHDPLTGLANRALFRNRLARALARANRRSEPVGLLLLDISRFKQINDSLGHTSGDHILEEVGRRLREHVRAEDTAARFGGDEFAVILGLVEEPGSVPDVIDRLLAVLRRPYATDGGEIEIDFNVGAAVHCSCDAPRTVETGRPDDLVRCADLALIRAKRKSGEFVHLYHPEKDGRGEDQLQREQDLRRGVQEREFEVFFQPVMELATGRIWGCEALARWRHPDRGLVSPAEFIPLAEETDIIHELGEQICKKAFRHATGWSDRMGDDAPFLLMNVSGRQFEADRFARSLDRCFEETGLSPDRVFAEVTESVITRAANRVRQLRQYGLGVLIDDFGTGYSSFHYLRDLEVDGLKIDMSFVQGLAEPGNSSAIVQTIITLGRQLEILTVAEGVEVEEQRRELEAMEPDLAQGYVYARPVPASEIESLLQGD